MILCSDAPISLAMPSCPKSNRRFLPAGKNQLAVSTGSTYLSIAFGIHPGFQPMEPVEVVEHAGLFYQAKMFINGRFFPAQLASEEKTAGRRVHCIRF